MTWEEQLFTYFDDLEQQAEGVFGIERELEVAERAAAEYAAVTAASRLMASVNAEVALQVQGLGQIEGRLRRVAGDWCMVQAGRQQAWIVRQDAVMTIRGTSPRSVPEAAWPVTGRLGFGSALRGLADVGEPCVLVLVDGTRFDACVVRVGQDFVELLQGDAREPALVRFGAIAAVTGDAGLEPG